MMSSSYPYLALSRALGVPYGLVLRYADRLDGRLEGVDLLEVLDTVEQAIYAHKHIFRQWVHEKLRQRVSRAKSNPQLAEQLDGWAGLERQLEASKYRILNDPPQSVKEAA